MWLILFCVALGVSARVAVGSFLSQLNFSLLKDTRALLSADLEITSKNPLGQKEKEDMARLLPPGSRSQESVNFVTMAAAPATGKSRLAEVRAAEPSYPFYGELRLAGDGGKIFDAVTPGEAAFVQKELLAQLGVGIGGRLKLGNKEFVIGGVIEQEPGLGANIFSFGPRILIPVSQVSATGLLGFGSRAYYSLFVALPGPELTDKSAALLKEQWNIPAQRGRFRESMGPEEGIQVRTPTDRQNQVRRFFDRLGDYLRLVSLMALLLGGIGVASVMRSFVVERLPWAATLRTLGASSGQIFRVFALQVGMMGVAGSLLGAFIGAGFQVLLPAILSEFIPVRYEAGLSWTATLEGLGLGLATALFFGLLPVLSLRGLKPLEVFRGDNPAGKMDRIPWAAVGLGAVLLSAVSVLESRSMEKGLFFSASFLASAGLLYALSRALFPWLARARLMFPSFGIRHGLANLARPQLRPHGAAAALGLCAFLLGALTVYQSSLLKELDFGSKPGEIPSFFIIDIQDDQAEPLGKFLDASGAAGSVISPMIKARYRGKNGEEINRDRGLTREAEMRDHFRSREQNLSFREILGRNETVTAGRWMAESGAGEPETSLEESFAERLGVGLGDLLTFDVQGVSVQARVTSLRRVNWASFLPAFFIYITPSELADAPKTWVGSVLGVGLEDKDRLQASLIRLFPNLTIIDVAAAAEKILGVLNKISQAVSFVALFSVSAGLVVLTGMALAALRQREKESALLKVLGGGQRTLFVSLAVEFGSLSAVSVLMGLMFSSGFSWVLLTRFLDIAFSFPWREIGILWVLLVILSCATGLWASKRVFAVRPLAILRFCLPLGAAVFLACGVFADEQKQKVHVRASLVTAAKNISPGKPFDVAVRLVMDKGWHTYADPPGDSGLATEILWDLPPGFAAGPIQWPKPKKHTVSDITDFIYEGKADLKVRITPPKQIAANDITLKARVKWLECSDVCLPGSAQVALTLKKNP